MAVSMIKFVAIFVITMATLGGVNGQITAIANELLQTNSLLANVTDTSIDISQTQAQILAAQTETQNTLTDISQTQTQTLETLNAMANTFNQVASLLEIQSQQLHNMTVAMNTMVSLLENQQDILRNISRSSPTALDPRIHQTYPPDQSIESSSSNDATSEKPIQTTTGMTTGTDGMTTGTARMTTGTARMTTGTDGMTIETAGMTPATAGMTTGRAEMTNTDVPQTTTTAVISAPSIQNCFDLVFFRNINYPSGIYSITPPNQNSSYNAYCDMDFEYGGWTVLQKRFDGSVDFHRSWFAWNDYKGGFGSFDGEFWLGLELVHLLTSSSGQSWELMIQLQDFNNDTAYARYQSFSIGDEASNYRLTIGRYSGTAGDSLYYHNNKPFSTFDRDNDRSSSNNCARDREGAWWYYSTCGYTNLNGMYLGPGPTERNDLTGMFWYHWKYSQSLKSSIMMMRPLTY
ncbi:uncharacterized protein [Amphiura filiformis]|uniref:uncharacterized protein isoform X2 n=1 Tax=Amphiura filiformis TaxID=82378 RepID=UPI003B20D206